MSDIEWEYIPVPFPKAPGIFDHSFDFWIPELPLGNKSGGAKASIFDLRVRQWSKNKGGWLGYMFAEAMPSIMNYRQTSLSRVGLRTVLNFDIGKIPTPIEEHPKGCWCRGCYLQRLIDTAPKKETVK